MIVKPQLPDAPGLQVVVGSDSEAATQSETAFSRYQPVERLHILFLIDELCEAGGAERVLLKTIGLLPKSRFRCSLATFRLDSSIDIFRQLPVPAYVFPMRRSYGWSGLRAAWKLRDLIRAEHVDIVHTFHETSDIWGTAVAKLSGCPVTVSSRRDMGILRSAKHRIGYRFAAPLYDQVQTVSEQVRTFCIEEDRLNPAKVRTIYNGIDLPQIATTDSEDHLRQQLGLQGASHIILTVGNIRPVKGFDIFVRAAAIVRRQFPRAVFLVVGDVTDREHHRQLKQLAHEQGDSSVQFWGPSEEILNFLSLSDVFCVPSRSEGFSNALLEAMACGVPCVATRVGGNMEAIVDGVNGFLIPPDDVEALADRVLRLLRDPETGTRMGRSARKTVEERFTVAAMISKLIESYEGLIDAQPGARRQVATS